MSSTSVKYYNRYSQSIEIEAIYGESFLKVLYCSLPGPVLLSLWVKRAWFSRLYGWMMSRPSSRSKVLPFVKKYGVDAETFEKAPSEFESFNDFFIRKLKSGARPIRSAENAVVFPADGRHLCISNMSKADGFFVKGEKLSLDKLLGDAKLADNYREGTLVLSRLCPTDYHRFHFPVSGWVSEAKLINGYYYSVNPIALRKNIEIFAENKRYVTEIEHAKIGKVLMLEVGATCVGSIHYTYEGGSEVKKGDEKGYFSFGGSSVLTLFPKDSVQLEEDLLLHSAEGREVYAHMGDSLGVFC